MSIIMLVLKYLNADVEYFIPDNFSEDCEISALCINNSIKYLGADLLLAVGCGTNSEDGICLCKKLGIDVVVVDYHKQYKKISNLLDLTLDDRLKKDGATLDKYYKQGFKDGINLLIECIK